MRPIDHSGDADVLGAFERALKNLGVDRRSPEALVVAERLVSFAKTGVCDTARLCDLTVQAIWIEWHARGHEKARAIGRC
jgi:hypothetical protein